MNESTQVIIISSTRLLPEFHRGRRVEYRTFSGEQAACVAEARRKSWIDYVQIAYYCPANKTLFVPVGVIYADA